MKITLVGLDGQQFTLRLPRDEGGEHVVTLVDTRRLRGTYEHDDTRFALDPVEADLIVCDIAWQLAAGPLHLAGPATLGATTLDLDIARGDRTPGLTGEARCASAAIPSFSLTRAGMNLQGTVNLTALDARHDLARNTWTLLTESLILGSFAIELERMKVALISADARLDVLRSGPDGLHLAIHTLRIDGLTLSFGDIILKADTAALTGLRLTQDAAGKLQIDVTGVALTDLSVDAGARRIQVPSLNLDTLRYAPEGVSFEHGALDTLSLWIDSFTTSSDAASTQPEEAPLPAGVRRTLGLDLPFLDHLNARIEADVVVDLKLPLIKRRVATHRMRLDVNSGVFDFKQLEGGLSKLEDAMFDFEVDDRGLLLEFDAVVMKRELVHWPLDASGLALARQRKVRARTFARPTVVTGAPQANHEPESERSVALHRITVQGIVFDGGLAGASSLPLLAGTLRLGRADTHALGKLRVTGSLVHDPAQRAPSTELALELSRLDVALDNLAVGEHTLTLSQLSLAQVSDTVLRFQGLKPAALKTTLRDLQVQGFVLKAPTPPALSSQ
jgi:hypothetical protein